MSRICKNFFFKIYIFFFLIGTRDNSTYKVIFDKVFEMKLILTVFSLYPMYQICYSIGCRTLPPGLDRLSHGIDITKFDLLPTDFTKSNGFARNIFDFTCNKSKKWTNLFIPTLVYDLPDQIESITHFPGGILDTEFDNYSSYQDIKNTQSSKVGLKFLGGMFGFSGTSTKSMEKIIANQRSLLSVSAHVSAIEVQLIPYWAVTESFYMREFYDKFLPNTYAENPAKYQEFLSLFGTHYFTTARFGGLLKVNIEINKNYAKTLSAQNMEIQASLSFLNIISLSGGYSKGSQRVDTNFKQNSLVKEIYYGGNANLITGANGFKNWWDSAQRNPWIFGGQLTSILNLIPEGAKKIALSTAYTVKLDYAYLDELSLSLTLLKRESYNNDLLKQIEALRKQDIPSHYEVQKLGLIVEEFIKPNFGGLRPHFGGGSGPQFGGGSRPHFGGGSRPQFGGGSRPQFGGGSRPHFGGGSRPQFGGGSRPQFGGGSRPRPNFGRP